MNFIEKKIKRTEIYDGKIIHAYVDDVELPNGRTSKREVVEHPGGVCVAALNENNQLLFVRQYRYPFSEVVLELPAGKLEKGQDPLENGKRELMEETGATGYGYVSLGKIYLSPGFSNEVLHMYFCRVSEMGDACPDENEFVQLEYIDIDKALKMVLDNEILDAKTQTTILKAYVMIKKGIL